MQNLISYYVDLIRSLQKDYCSLVQDYDQMAKLQQPVAVLIILSHSVQYLVLRMQIVSCLGL
jgi:hypothetical protein